ncbi:hypothetical protein ACIGB6_10120 [Paeniglutamicibacter gangotriensis]
MTESHLGRLTKIANTEAPPWFGQEAADGYSSAMAEILEFIEGIQT